MENIEAISSEQPDSDHINDGFAPKLPK